MLRLSHCAGALLALAMTMYADAANYSAARVSVEGFDVIRLSDAGRKMEVSIVPSLGNIAYDMRVNGAPVLFSPYQSLAQFKAKPALLGVPFLGPWANRLDQDAYFANGRKYLLNPGLGNYRYDPNHQPIHGLLSFTDAWQVTEVHADASGAEAQSRLEVWRHPDWMAQFPFAHTVRMTYRLSGGALEVHLAIENLSAEPMPVSVAFHPYFQLTDAPRDAWRVHLAARSHYTLSSKLIPTGQTTPVEQSDSITLAGVSLDDVYGDLKDQDEFWVEGKTQKIAVRFGPKYPVAVVYAPPGRNLICFEPMSGVTNAFNLNQAGLYPELQSIAPGAVWEESFWIRPSGF